MQNESVIYESKNFIIYVLNFHKVAYNLADVFLFNHEMNELSLVSTFIAALLNNISKTVFDLNYLKFSHFETDNNSTYLLKYLLKLFI